MKLDRPALVSVEIARYVTVSARALLVIQPAAAVDAEPGMVVSMIVMDGEPPSEQSSVTNRPSNQAKGTTDPGSCVIEDSSSQVRKPNRGRLLEIGQPRRRTLIDRL
jgi:hypothetical protein